MAERIPIEDLPLENVHLLRAVLEELNIEPAERPQEFVMSIHAKLVADLAEEIVLLESQNHRAASPVIARAIYESLFKLVLALKNPELSTEYTLREVEWSKIQEEIKGARQRDLKEIRKRPEYAPIAKLVSRLGQRWKLASKQIASDYISSTYAYARDAEMVPLYQRQYAELSGFAHASARTFLSRIVGRTTTGLVLAYVTFAIITALNRIAEKYRTSLPPDRLLKVQQSNRLFQSCSKPAYFHTRPTSPAKKFQKN
jgi:hypothetical protein